MSDYWVCSGLMIFMLVWGYVFGYVVGKESAEERLRPASEPGRGEK